MAGGSIPGLTFEWSVVVSGLMAGVVCTLVTVVIEKFGGVVGGILGSMPTTIIPAALGFYYTFIGLGSADGTTPTQAGVSEFQRSMISSVPGMLLNALYLLAWRYIPTYVRARYPSLSLLQLLAVVFTAAILIWLALAVALVVALRELAANIIIPVDGAPVSSAISPAMTTAFAIGFATLGLQIVAGVVAGWTPPPAPKSTAKVPPGVLVLRGVAAALAIGAAIVIGKTSSWAGGLASVFPVIFTSSIVAVWLSSGEAVSSGAIGPLMLGSASVSVFSLVAAILVGADLGFGIVIAIAWVASVVGITVPSFLYLRWRREVTASHALVATKEEEAFAVEDEDAFALNRAGESSSSTMVRE
ncbi:hypothetical protein H9P43_002183 [Blastocladiella emersonii ATCC 22665]|nr:hypothetical protein H9P43_002183 [Blastocladiella emersonii ATCC 22665]